MKQKIFDALKTKFEGLSDSLLNRVAEKLAKTVTTDEQVETAVAGVTLMSIIEGENDRRAQEASASAVANYEKKHNLKDGKIVETAAPAAQPQTNNGGAEIPEWAKKIIEGNDALKAELAEMKGQKVADTRRKQLNEIVATLPSSLQKAYSHAPVEGTEEEFEELKASIAKEVEEADKEFTAKKAVFGTPNKGGAVSTASKGNEKEATKEEVADAMAQLRV